MRDARGREGGAPRGAARAQAITLLKILHKLVVRSVFLFIRYLWVQAATRSAGTITGGELTDASMDTFA